MSTSPHVVSLFHADTSTFTHVVCDREGGRGAIVDPVRDFDPASGRIAHTAADEVIAVVQRLGLTIDWILETHAHADHLSAAPYLKSRLGGRIAIGRAIGEVQAIFEPRFHPGEPLPAHGPRDDGFDHLFDDGDTFAIGDLQATAWHVPGHTPADMAFAVGDAVFVGDTLFPPDVGTARCDFPGGDARMLYRSVQRLLALPDDTRLFMCHDYPPTGREPQAVCTVADERRHNIHIHEGTSEAEFVALRQARDATLAVPRLILPSIQVNIRAGQLPPPDVNGTSYLRWPLSVA
ncbi:MAG: MBL fold metallo-hydrolase [Proteobacteria bacterium]|uniref:MBL fold metallo-hydrolase n=1 Tax=Aquabacterium sp. TaxID=1872578 RepID=UPI0035C757FE|nr:MBL fold metallo-hydrolase [Pseudomonadota bacterium]